MSYYLSLKNLLSNYFYCKTLLKRANYYLFYILLYFKHKSVIEFINL